jgi:hypothetical protein
MTVATEVSCGAFCTTYFSTGNMVVAVLAMSHGGRITAAPGRGIANGSFRRMGTSRASGDSIAR